MSRTESPPPQTLPRRVGSSPSVRRSFSPERTKSQSQLLSGQQGSANPNTASPHPESNIQVALRCRPLSAQEKKEDVTATVLCNSERNCVTVNYALLGGPKKIARTWEFDRVFGMYSTQVEVFDATVRPILAEAINGFNCTVFAYGPTGTGAPNIHSYS
jgi:hypothetical protein